MNKNKSLYCPICRMEKKSSNKKYCDNHEEAQIAIQKGYELWLRAYGILSWEDYLQNLLRPELITGEFIKDVAEYELYFKKKDS
ncbi:MAG: hypothetical protein ACTSSG_03865 [Candidatus Heimdallarchaeaceae archaeon]